MYKKVDINFMYLWPYQVQRKLYHSNSYSCINFYYRANYVLIKINQAHVNIGWNVHSWKTLFGNSRCVFTAFVSLQSLHSSLNARGGLGVASLSCIYGATVLSAFIAPPVIHRLTTKWTVAAAFLLFVIYFTINFFPHGLMLIPASLLLGFLTGPLWSAQGTYLTTLAIRYAQSTQQVHEPVISKFNGIFTSIYQSSQILGHLVSIIVLSFNPNNPPDYRYNFQYTHIDRYVAINKTWHSYNLNCGSHGCGLMQEFPTDDVILHRDAPVPFHIRNLLLGIHVGFSVLGLTLVVTLLDRGEVMVTEGKHPLSTSSSHQLFLATLHMFQDPRLQLLLPLVLFIGLDQGFVFSDFTKVTNQSLSLFNFQKIWVQRNATIVVG